MEPHIVYYGVVTSQRHGFRCSYYQSLHHYNTHLSFPGVNDHDQYTVIWTVILKSKEWTFQVSCSLILVNFHTNWWLFFMAILMIIMCRESERIWQCFSSLSQSLSLAVPITSLRPYLLYYPAQDSTQRWIILVVYPFTPKLPFTIITFALFDTMAQLHQSLVCFFFLNDVNSNGQIVFFLVCDPVICWHPLSITSWCRRCPGKPMPGLQLYIINNLYTGNPPYFGMHPLFHMVFNSLIHTMRVYTTLPHILVHLLREQRFLVGCDSWQMEWGAMF